MTSKSALETFVNAKYQELDQGHHAGLAIAVVSADEVLLTKGYGFRNRKDKTRVKKDTLFAIGSVTKPFTSLAAMMTVGKDIAGLQSPVLYFDNDFAMMDPLATAEISLEDMLCQRSGVPRNDGLWYMADVPLPEIHRRLRYIAPDAQPLKGFRKGFYYNNLVYSSAGVILEKIEKTSWSKLIKDSILDPIGMTNTSTSVSTLTKSKNWAEPYAGDTRMCVKDMKNIAPAGAINSNVIDMAAWLQVFLRDGVLASGDRLIAKRHIKQVRARRVLDVAGFGAGCDYGLGWFITRAAGRDLVWCPGNADGYSAYASYMPSLGLGVVALVNQQVSTLGEELATAIYKHKLGIDPAKGLDEPRSTNHHIAKLGLAPKPESDAFPLDVEAPPAGRYEHAVYGAIRITNSGKKLKLAFGGNNYDLVRQPHGGYCFAVMAFGFAYQVPVVFQDDPAAGECLRIPFEPASGWLTFYHV